MKISHGTQPTELYFHDEESGNNKCNVWFHHPIFVACDLEPIWAFLSPLQPKSVPVTWIHEVSMMSEGFTACQERMGVKVKELEEYYSSYGLGRFPGWPWMGRGKLQLATRGGDQPTHENSRRRDGLFLRQPTSVIAGLWIPELRPTCCFFDCTGLPVNHHCEVARSYREFCVPTGTRTHTHTLFFLLFSFSLSLSLSISLSLYAYIKIGRHI